MKLLTDREGAQRIAAYRRAVARLKPRLCPKCGRVAMGWPLWTGPERCSDELSHACRRHPRKEWTKATPADLRRLDRQHAARLAAYRRAHGVSA